MSSITEEMLVGMEANASPREQSLINCIRAQRAQLHALKTNLEGTERDLRNIAVTNGRLKRMLREAKNKAELLDDAST